MLIHSRIFLTGIALSVSSAALAAPGYDVVSGPVDDDSTFFSDGTFQLSVLAGVASINQDNGQIVVTRSETDTLLQNSNEWDSWTAQIGVGYKIPLYWQNDEDNEEDREESEIYWFGSVTPQLNVYIMNGGNLEGDVKRFNDPDDIDATYDMNFDSTRLMFDVALDVLTVRDFSFYALAGLGVAWNSSDFTLTPNPGVPIHGLNLQENESAGFAYEFGAGIDYAVIEEMDITLQYLYSVLNDVSVSGHDDIFNVTSNNMNIDTQALFLGVRFGV